MTVKRNVNGKELKIPLVLNAWASYYIKLDLGYSTF
jgi:hypothetical protein